MEINLFNKIEELEKKGLFLKAINLIDNNLNNLKKYDQPYYKNKKSNLLQNHNEFYHTKVGEALFPVINETNNQNFLAKIKLLKDETLDQDNTSLEKIKNSIKIAFNKYLNNSKIFIKNYLRFFEWNLPNYSITVYNKDGTINIKNISGNSYELALAAAYISLFLNIPIKQNIVFSGVLLDDNINIVDYIEEKYNLVKNVFLDNFTFVCNSTINEHIKKIENISALFDFSFEGSPYEKLLENKDNIDNYFSLNFSKRTFLNSKGANIEFDIAEFKHNNLKQSYIQDVFNYLGDIRKIMEKDYCKNLIISGIKPNYFLSFLIIPLFNHIKSTLAIKNSQLQNDKEAVVVLAKDPSIFSTGDLI